MFHKPIIAINVNQIICYQEIHVLNALYIVKLVRINLKNVLVVVYKNIWIKTNVNHVLKVVNSVIH